MVDRGGKTARIVARTQEWKRDRFYEIARALKLDAANLVNCLVDAFIEAYDARGEISFPLEIKLAQTRVHGGENGAHGQRRPGGDGKSPETKPLTKPKS